MHVRHFQLIFVCFLGSSSFSCSCPLCLVALRYIFALIDATVYPANANLVKSACDALGILLNMNAQNIGHVQLPVVHTNTTQEIVLKHRRLIEDNLHIQQKLDISQTVALHFSLADDAPASDKRGGVQTCLFVTADGQACPWISPRVVGPQPLIRIRDMIGFDADSKPGASARASQILRINVVIIFAQILWGPAL